MQLWSRSQDKLLLTVSLSFRRRLLGCTGGGAATANLACDQFVTCSLRLDLGLVTAYSPPIDDKIANKN
jgi:hypothetical protein